MFNEQSIDVPRWYAVRTNPQQENRADINLRAWEVETLSPKVKEKTRDLRAGAARYVLKPLFPQYIFARFKLRDMLHKVRFTRGVKTIVHFGDTPAPINDEIIDIIVSQMDERGLVNLREDIRAGDKVIVKDGPLKDFVGVFEREASASDRVRILLTAVGYQSHLTIGRDSIRKIKIAA
jgi:transcription elongation factor/antiterminator RfaH